MNTAPESHRFSSDRMQVTMYVLPRILLHDSYFKRRQETLAMQSELSALCMLFLLSPELSLS